MERYHTILRRIAAWLIDFVPFIPVLIVGAIYYRYAQGTVLGVAWTLAMSFCCIAYSIYFHGRYGATPGKAMMKCRVVSVQKEEKIGFRVATLRETPWMVMGALGAFEDHWAKIEMPTAASAIAILTTCWLFADDFVALIHSKRRAIHDILSGTVVVKEETNQQPEPMSGLPHIMAHQ